MTSQPISICHPAVPKEFNSKEYSTKNLGCGAETSPKEQKKGGERLQCALAIGLSGVTFPNLDDNKQKHDRSISISYLQRSCSAVSAFDWQKRQAHLPIKSTSTLKLVMSRSSFQHQMVPLTSQNQPPEDENASSSSTKIVNNQQLSTQPNCPSQIPTLQASPVIASNEEANANNPGYESNSLVKSNTQEDETLAISSCAQETTAAVAVNDQEMKKPSECEGNSNNINQQNDTKSSVNPTCSTISDLKENYLHELEFMCSEFRKLEQQLLWKQPRNQHLTSNRDDGESQLPTETPAARQRREKLQCFIRQLDDIIKQITSEGHSSLPAAVDQVTKLEQHITKSILPVKARLIKQLQAQGHHHHQHAPRHPVHGNALGAPRNIPLSTGTTPAVSGQSVKLATASINTMRLDSQNSKSAGIPFAFASTTRLKGGSSLTQKLYRASASGKPETSTLNPSRIDSIPPSSQIIALPQVPGNDSLKSPNQTAHSSLVKAWTAVQTAALQERIEIGNKNLDQNEHVLNRINPNSDKTTNPNCDKTDGLDISKACEPSNTGFNFSSSLDQSKDLAAEFPLSAVTTQLGPRDAQEITFLDSKPSAALKSEQKCSTTSLNRTAEDLDAAASLVRVASGPQLLTTRHEQPPDYLITQASELPELENTVLSQSSQQCHVVAPIGSEFFEASKVLSTSDTACQVIVRNSIFADPASELKGDSGFHANSLQDIVSSSSVQAKDVSSIAALPLVSKSAEVELSTNSSGLVLEAAKPKGGADELIRRKRKKKQKSIKKKLQRKLQEHLMMSGATNSSMRINPYELHSSSRIEVMQQCKPLVITQTTGQFHTSQESPLSIQHNGLLSTFANPANHNRNVEYMCSTCNEKYTKKISLHGTKIVGNSNHSAPDSIDTCDMKHNPWWAIRREECPKCHEQQIPRIDISSPCNLFEYHPALLAHINEDGNSSHGGSHLTSIIPQNLPTQYVAPASPVIESTEAAQLGSLKSKGDNHSNRKFTYTPLSHFGSAHYYPSLQHQASYLKRSASYASESLSSSSSDSADCAFIDDSGSENGESAKCNNLDEIDDTEDEEDLERELLIWEKYGNEDYGNSYSGPKLSEADSARILVLMNHASTCPGRHNNPKHSEVCQSIKYLMLHIRDCPGILTVFSPALSQSNATTESCNPHEDTSGNSPRAGLNHLGDENSSSCIQTGPECTPDNTREGEEVSHITSSIKKLPETSTVPCPFVWCRPVKHLLYHLVNCKSGPVCAICHPSGLSKNLSSLSHLSANRRKKRRLAFAQACDDITSNVPRRPDIDAHAPQADIQAMGVLTSKELSISQSCNVERKKDLKTAVSTFTNNGAAQKPTPDAKSFMSQSNSLEPKTHELTAQKSSALEHKKLTGLNNRKDQPDSEDCSPHQLNVGSYQLPLSTSPKLQSCKTEVDRELSSTLPSSRVDKRETINRAPSSFREEVKRLPKFFPAKPVTTGTDPLKRTNLALQTNHHEQAQNHSALRASAGNHGRRASAPPALLATITAACFPPQPSSSDQRQLQTFSIPVDTSKPGEMSLNTSNDRLCSAKSSQHSEQNMPENAQSVLTNKSKFTGVSSNDSPEIRKKLEVAQNKHFPPADYSGGLESSMTHKGSINEKKFESPEIESSRSAITSNEGSYGLNKAPPIIDEVLETNIKVPDSGIAEATKLSSDVPDSGIAKATKLSSDVPVENLGHAEQEYDAAVNHTTNIKKSSEFELDDLLVSTISGNILANGEDSTVSNREEAEAAANRDMFLNGSTNENFIPNVASSSDSKIPTIPIFPDNEGNLNFLDPPDIAMEDIISPCVVVSSFEDKVDISSVLPDVVDLKGKLSDDFINNNLLKPNCDPIISGFQASEHRCDQVKESVSMELDEKECKMVDEIVCIKVDDKDLALVSNHNQAETQIAGPFQSDRETHAAPDENQKQMACAASEEKFINPDP